MGVSCKFAVATIILTAGALAGCATEKPGNARDALVSPVNCSPTSFEVYFNEGQASLTNAARQAIALTAGRLTGCQIRSVAVTGLSDAQGSAAANLNLSEQRAQAVSEAMAAAGWPSPVFEVQAVGADGARTGSINEPLRRRTEVVVDAVPRR